MLHHVHKWCGNVKRVKTQVANKRRRNIEALQTTKQQSLEMPFSRCWRLIIRTRYIKSWNFFSKCKICKLKLTYRLDHFLHPVANTTRIIICLYIFNQGNRGIPSPLFTMIASLGGHGNPPPPWSHLFEAMIGLSTGDGRQILTWEESVPGTLKRTAIFCTWKMDGKGIRPRFGLFGFISAYFCSWCVLLVSGKGISRSSGPHSFKCSGSMYLVCLWRSYMRWWKGGIFTIKLKPRDCRIIPTLILEDTNQSNQLPLHLAPKNTPEVLPWFTLKIRPWNRGFLTWRPIIFRWIMLNVWKGHGFAQIFSVAFWVMSSTADPEDDMFGTSNVVQSVLLVVEGFV